MTTIRRGARLPLLTLALLAAGFLAAAPANADKSASPGCGSTPGKSANPKGQTSVNGTMWYTEWRGTASNGHIRMLWEQDCNIGPLSVEIEIQTTANTGIWHDIVIGGVKQDRIMPTNYSGYDVRVYEWPQATCVSSAGYRVVTIDFNSTNTRAIDCP